MPEKIRYEIDPYNRLVVIDKSLSVPKQRRALDGKFAVGKNNSLEYHVKSPAGYSDNSPHQVKLKGSWGLTKDHDLRFSIDRSARVRSYDAFTIKGDIIDTKGSSILFSVTTRRGADLQSTYVLELSRGWQADPDNRLSFNVKRQSGKSDALQFDAGWELDKNNEIVYRYEKSRLKRGIKTVHSLILKGRWVVNDAGSISYEVGSEPGSAIDFKAFLDLAGEDYLKFQLGIKLSARARPVKRAITLFGSWRIKKGAGLYFDVECEDGRIYSISFSADARLSSKDTVSLTLKDTFGKNDLGLKLELQHALLGGDGSAFLRAMRSRGESGVFVGAGFNW